MGIYDRIKDLCVKRGISIRQIEAKAGLGNGAIGRWKNYSPTVESLKKVAEALEVPVSYLLGENDSGIDINLT